MNNVRFIDCIDVVGTACPKFDGEKKYISTGAVEINNIDDEQIEIIDYKNKPSRANVVVKNGDVLFAKMQATIKVLEINDELANNVYSTGFYAVKPKEGILTNRCLYHLLKSKDFNDKKDKECHGATQKALNNEGLAKINISIPDFGKQEQIGKELDCIDKIIQDKQKEIELLDELVKSRFIEQFGDVTINNKNWDTKPLKKLCDISRGGSPRPIVNYLGGTIPWIKISDATGDDSIYINSTKEHIIEEGIKKSRYIKSGSLIFANCGVSLGFCRIIKFDGCIHDGWLAFQNIDKSLDKVFLLITINQLTTYFRSIAPGGTQPNLNTEIMGNYLQILPPLDMQKDFIKFVEKVDKSKFICQQKINLYQELLDKKMDEYFNNETK